MTPPFLNQHPSSFSGLSPLSSKKFHTPTPKWLNFWKVLPPPLIRGEGSNYVEDIFPVSLMQNWMETHMFYLVREVRKFGHVLPKKKLTLWSMNSNMVKPEKFGHLHLVYHFIVLLMQNKLKLKLNYFDLSSFWVSKKSHAHEV